MLIDEYVDRILDQTHVQYFLSSSHDGGRIEWPWRMFPPSEATQRYVDIADVYAVDSEPQSPSVTNQDVLDTAHDLDADVALLVDYFPFDVYRQHGGPLFDTHGDLRPGKEDDLEAFETLTDQYDSANAASIASVQAGMDLADQHPFDGTIWVPLQAPHVESYHRLGEPDHVAIGGLKDADPAEKVQTARALRDAAGPHTHIHGLGYGPSTQVVEAVRYNPGLLDSIDAKTAGAEATQTADIWRGDETSTPLAAHVAGRLLESCRRMSPLGDDPNGDNAYLSQFHD